MIRSHLVYDSVPIFVAPPSDFFRSLLVLFPQVLTVMNGSLNRTQQLDYAFADQQAAVLDTAQRLRRQAQASGPTSYGASGIMTFQINRDGVIFQKDEVTNQ